MLIRSGALLTAMAVFMWVMPLGLVIKPSQEGMACGGKRAFHQCSSSFKPSQEAAGSHLQWVNDTGTTTKRVVPTGGGNDYLISSHKDLRMLLRNKKYEQLFSFNPFALSLRVDHIPI